MGDGFPFPPSVKKSPWEAGETHRVGQQCCHRIGCVTSFSLLNKLFLLLWGRGSLKFIVLVAGY